MKVWYRLFHSNGNPFKDSSADKVIVDDNADIADLRDTIKNKNKNKLASVDSPDLKIYKRKEDFDKKEPIQKSSTSIDGFGKDEDNAVYVLVPDIQPTGTFSNFYWGIEAKVSGAFTTMGVRSTVYMISMDNQAFYSPQLGMEKSITYDMNNEHLSIDLVFKTEQNALNFETALRKFIDGFSHQGDKSLSLDISNWSISSYLLQEPDSLIRVLTKHYKPTDYDSPNQSLEDMHIRDLSLTTSLVDISEDIFTYQRIEHEKFFKLSKPDKCHLIDKAVCSKVGEYAKYKYNDNNVVALSRDLHGYFDAINGGIPGFLLAIKSISEHKSSTTNRYQVDIYIEFFNSDACDLVSFRLNPGSCVVKEGSIWQTTLCILDVEEFKECVTWKKDKISGIWGRCPLVDSLEP